MRLIKFLLIRFSIFAFLLAIIGFSILYLRPDIKPIHFLQDLRFLIIPISLLYLVLNFERLLTSNLNRILLLSIFGLVGYSFYPGAVKSAQPLVSTYLNQVNPEKIKSTVNDLLTPKDGSKPAFQIGDGKSSDTLNSAPTKQLDSSDQLFVDLGKMKKNEISSVIPNLSSQQISDLAQQPISFLSDLTKMAPQEIQNKLAKLKINVSNPSQSITDLVGDNTSNQRQALDSIFK